MKKLFSFILAMFMTIPCFTGCGKVVEEIDKNKTQIYVNVFNGGLGTAWMDDLIAQFNATNDKYQAVIRPRKFTGPQVVEDVSDGESYADIYFACGVDYQTGIYRDYFEDLSDVFLMEPNGAGKGTVKDNMIIDYAAWHKMASKYGQGDYIFPNAETLYGMNFDYQVFVENNWLAYATEEDEAALSAQGIQYQDQGGILKFVSATGKVNYKAGDIILAAGKDGKFGTYDDGQPTTVEEFDDMLSNIVNGNKKAKTFLYTPEYSNYLNDMQSAIFGQYIGMENFHALFDFNSNGTEFEMHDGSTRAITVNNGYEVYRTEAVYQSLAFLKKYMTSPDVDPNTLKESSYSHTDAQNDYLLGYKKSTGFPAILCEGNWWENEARTMFDNLAKENANRGFGKREYRMFVYPTIDGQITASDKTVIGGGDLQGVVVVKQQDKQKLAKIKEFLLLSCKEENLKKFTQFTGCSKLFNYDLTEEEMSTLTPYARNCWEMRQDKEHIEIAYSRILQAGNPFIFTSDFTYYTYVPLKRGVVYTLYTDRFLRDLDDFAAPDETDSLKVLELLYSSKSDLLGYSQDQWNNYIAMAQQEGFFTDL